MRRGEAPLRRSFGTTRNGQIFDGQQWEEWETWSNRKITSKCEAMRMMITVFARPVDDRPINAKRGHQLEEEEEENRKKPKMQEADQHLKEFEAELFPEKKIEEDKREEIVEIPHQEHGEKVSKHCQEKNNSGSKRFIKTLDIQMLENSALPLKDNSVIVESIEAISDFHCSVCHEMSQPKRARPASLPEESRVQ